MSKGMKNKNVAIKTCWISSFHTHRLVYLDVFMLFSFSSKPNNHKFKFLHLVFSILINSLFSLQMEPLKPPVLMLIPHIFIYFSLYLTRTYILGTKVQKPCLVSPAFLFPCCEFFFSVLKNNPR